MSDLLRGKTYRWPALIIWGGLLCWLGGCDTDVAPVLGTGQAYSLFGLFTPELDTQRVLVFPIENELRLLPNEKLDARFSSIDQSNQQTAIWNDSLIAQPNGEYNHLFWSPFRAEYGRTYSVVVEDDEGGRTEVAVAVPPESEVVLLEPDLRSEVLLPVLVQGEVPNLLKVEVMYGFDYEQLSLGEKLENLVLSLDDRKERVDDGWIILINLSRDYRTIRDYIRSQRAINLATGIRLRGILLRFLVTNAEWSPPNGEFDPDILVQPGTMSNVVNGFGFVGAGYRVRTNWLPADSVVAQAGFR